jgi:hypothetical protein
VAGLLDLGEETLPQRNAGMVKADRHDHGMGPTVMSSAITRWAPRR